MNTAAFKQVVDKVLLDFPGIDFEIFAYRLIVEVLIASKEPGPLPTKTKHYESVFSGGEHKKTCLVCGKEFLGKSHQKMCGQVCARARQKQRDLARWDRLRVQARPPSLVSTPPAEIVRPPGGF